MDFLDEPLLYRFFDADLGFHLTVVRAHNQRALRLVSELRVAQRIFEYERVAHTPRLVDDAAAQHSEILEALLAGWGEASGEAMARHIRASVIQALHAFERRPARGMVPPRPALSPIVARRLSVAAP
jgi:DNA-binding GntR family transcriptional regulator